MSASGQTGWMPGAEPMSHTADGSSRGALVLHGFTGNPSSVRGVAEAFVGAGYHVELPCLPGHGTVIDDMLKTGWPDWTAVVEDVYQRLRERADQIVVAGLSMGGSLALWAGGEHPDIAGLICINPATKPQAPEVIEMVTEMLSDGTEVLPAIGGDIADPDVVESSYDGTPLRAFLTFMEGLDALTARYGTMSLPMRLFTSRQDHVVEPEQSEYLVDVYGGDVEHTWLERSYHVATQDYDRSLILDEAVAFADRVTARLP